MGSLAAIVSSDDVIGYSNGTSFSSPIMAGAVTCLWQALPLKTNIEILNLVLASSDRYEYPDNQYGYGIPDLWSAYLSITSNESLVISNMMPICYPNPVDTWLYIKSNIPLFSWQLFDLQGCLQLTGVAFQIDFSSFPEGIYVLKILQGNDIFVYKIINQ